MIEIVSTNKPPQVVATATAVVEAEQESWDDILDAGLKALGESRTSLFGYYLTQGEVRVPYLEPVFKMTGTFKVHANRD